LHWPLQRSTIWINEEASSKFWETIAPKNLNDPFTEPVQEGGEASNDRAQRVFLDDFGTQAAFEALNSFGAGFIASSWRPKYPPVHNAGPGFVHYTVSGDDRERCRVDPVFEGD